MRLPWRLYRLRAGRLLGTDEVAVYDKPVSAKHYALSGQIQRDLWYDSECNLVCVAFLGRDGSGITLELL